MGEILTKLIVYMNFVAGFEFKLCHLKIVTLLCFCNVIVYGCINGAWFRDPTTCDDVIAIDILNVIQNMF